MSGENRRERGRAFVFQGRLEFRDQGRRLDFRGALKSLTDEVRLRTHTRTVTFDSRSASSRRNGTEDTEGWGFKGKGNGTAELVSVEDRDAQWIKQLSEQAEHYFQADRA